MVSGRGDLDPADDGPAFRAESGATRTQYGNETRVLSDLGIDVQIHGPVQRTRWVDFLADALDIGSLAGRDPHQGRSKHDAEKSGREIHRRPLLGTPGGKAIPQKRNFGRVY